MSKKKLYRMLTFAFISYALIGIFVFIAFNPKSNWYKDRNDTQLTMNTSDFEVKTSDDANSTDNTNSEESSQSTEDDTNSQVSSLHNESNTEESSIDTQADVQNDSVNSLEVNQQGQKDNSSDSQETTLVFSGDIYMSDYITNKYAAEGISGILSQNLQKEFTNADIAMVNEEFPFSNRGTAMKNKQFTFRIDPKWVEIFQNMQLDIVTLGNNHTLDYGTEALTDTFDTLTTAHIQYVGAGNNTTEAKTTKYLSADDKTIAVLGASRVIPVPDWNATNSKPGLFTTYDPTAILEEIEVAKEQSDFVVVYVHWGIERETTPKDYQRTLAKKYIDAGADLVIGSHPHVLQGIEYYKGKPIVYSLGNFMFYNSIEQTVLLKVSLKADQVQVQLLPCKAQNALTQEVEDSTEKTEFYNYMAGISYGVSFDENGVVIE